MVDFNTSFTHQKERERTDIVWEFDMYSNNFIMRKVPTPPSPLRLSGTDYLIDRIPIGCSKRSSVYKAKDTKSNVTLAVKISPKKKNIQAEIQNERNILSDLPEHPNIIRYYDFIDTPKKTFLFLEYGGISLRVYLDSLGGRMTEAKARPLFSQMIESIIFLHVQQQISHHDIKLDNYIIDSTLTVRLIDFGFAIRYESGEDKISHFFGSLAYASAEVQEQQPHSPEKVDVFSLGVCFYQVLCGRLPFCDPSVDDRKTLLAKVKRGTFTFPIEVFLSERMKTLLHGMMAVREDDRMGVLIVHKTFEGGVG
eukprot:TRINITY_DN17563_c0_g1_i1.p1 TRINITY_DN17563_c0_g1~~TRINITY_DN17563_c0_g1_i1.p1  ORF type:complete len:310 (-),score=37.09 TRINITY_DN17563_c0_g1_i1:139-1068(-)